MSERDPPIEALFWEIHAEIEDAARAVLSGIGSNHAPVRLAYPPNEELTAEELDSLRSLQLNSAQRSGLRKLVADAASRPSFRAFCLIDGVGDPEQYPIGEWLGLRICKAEEDDPQEEMLHDAFFETWWAWKSSAKQMRMKRQ